MKKSVQFFFATLLLAAFGYTAGAQNSANTAVAASAKVLSDLTISNTSVSFGNITSTSGGEVKLVPQGTGHTRVGVNAAIGTVTISGSVSTNIRVGWPLTVPLSDGSGHTITYTLATSGSTANDGQGASSNLTLIGGYKTVMTHTDGYYYLWVGGSLGTLSGQTAGTYTGSATFTVDYN